MVVYTGVLPVAMDDAGLAVVMGHEIAHAIAEHGNERMSQGLIAQLGGTALSTALSTKPEATRQLWMSVYGVGSQYGALMPYGRMQESEADHLGLVFMTMAGYDPNVAVTFWERMAAPLPYKERHLRAWNDPRLFGPLQQAVYRLYPFDPQVG